MASCLHQPLFPHRAQETVPLTAGGLGVGVKVGMEVGVIVGVEVTVGSGVGVLVEGGSVAVGGKEV